MIYKGSDLEDIYGCMVLVGAYTYKAEKETPSLGRKETIINLLIRPEGGTLVRPKVYTVFESEQPALYEAIKVYCDATKKETRGNRDVFPVQNFPKMVEEFKDNETLAQWLRFPALHQRQMPLRKGECYRTTTDGQLYKNEKNETVTAKEVTVWCQPRAVADTPEGLKVLSWLLDPTDELRRIEDRIWQKPVKEDKPAPVVASLDVDASDDKSGDETPF